uniref:Uncharacterized protein n=1 Tax=Pseudomonas phage RVTF4 TaxID=3236931 RepID=A0AB39CD07_9VIRU
MGQVKLTQFALKGEFDSPILFALNHMEHCGAYTVHACHLGWAFDAGERLIKRYHRSSYQAIHVSKKEGSSHQFGPIRRK